MAKGKAVAKPTVAPIDSMMVWAMLVTGLMAGFVAQRELLFVTPIISGLVYIAAKVAFRGHEETQVALTSEFPPEISAALERAIGRLPAAGDARRLLGDVVREARPLFAMKASAFDASKDAEARAQAAELLIASCDTALELSQLDDMLDVHTAPDGVDLPTDMSLLNKLSSGRDLFANRLRAASLALSGLYASGIENGTPASDRVAELVAELKADAEARNAAKREMKELLSPES